jgi:ATP-dependent Zn protease
MISEYAMSDDLGPIYLGDTPEDEYYSDVLNEQAALCLQSLLKELYVRTEKIMLVHKAELIALSEALLENETLYSEQVAEILQKFENK